MDETLLKQWKKDEQAVFSGWDFSYISKRSKEENPPWDYLCMAKRLMKKSIAVLDMETGGGEKFSKLVPFPKHAVAFEGYKPNVPVARKRLKPLGVKVVEHDGNKLPFKDEEFDLVLNRHGSVNEDICREIFRILMPGGVFLTQQVAYGDLPELRRIFEPQHKLPPILKNTKKNLAKAGFKIIMARQWKGSYIFKDVGAIVYYLKAMPWSMKGFSIDKHIGHLKKLQDKLERKGRLEFTTSRFLIMARKK